MFFSLPSGFGCLHDWFDSGWLQFFPQLFSFYLPFFFLICFFEFCFDIEFSVFTNRWSIDSHPNNSMLILRFDPIAVSFINHLNRRKVRTVKLHIPEIIRWLSIVYPIWKLENKMIRTFLSQIMIFFGLSLWVIITILSYWVIKCDFSIVKHCVFSLWFSLWCDVVFSFDVVASVLLWIFSTIIALQFVEVMFSLVGVGFGLKLGCFGSSLD